MDEWWAFVILIAMTFVEPFGKFNIKKAYESKVRDTRRLIVGNFLIIILTPVLHLFSYTLVSGYFVSPVMAISIFWNLLFAWYLKEGEAFNLQTLQLMFAFSIGMGLTFVAYIDGTGKDKQSWQEPDWDNTVLYMGIWIAMLSGLLSFGLFNEHPSVFFYIWCAVGGLLGSLDVVMNIETVSFRHDHNTNTEVAIATFLGILAICSQAGLILLTNALLKRYDLHRVNPVIVAVNLFGDILADLLIFSRYDSWNWRNYLVLAGGVSIMSASMLKLS